MKKVIVIGGGAAGMMAAIACARQGASVTLIEKNEKLGKKLFITGKGRCNVTNAAGPEQIFENIVTNEKFFYSAFYGFDNQSVIQLLEKAGCPLKTERGDRVFPVSDHSSDVCGALNRELQKLGVTILLQTKVEGIVTSKEGENRVNGVYLSSHKTLDCDACIVCTGGLSYASTGSTGDGFEFAKTLGHSVTECVPALVPLETKEEWCKDVMGLSLKNVEFTLSNGKKEIYNGFGEMLFTHFGISGPLVLSASSLYSKQKDKKGVMGYIDLKPALTLEQLDKRILRDFEENKNKQFKNSLGGLFPQRLIPIMISLSGIHPEHKVNEITKAQRAEFVALIKKLPLTITGTRSFDEAIITQGGIKVKEINPSTMESKLVPGLYFAGEVLDLDAMTGGFNLQIAWSTGHLAGESAADAE